MILVILTAVCFIPVKQQVIVKVNAPYFNSYNQMSNLSNWKQWYPALATAYQADVHNPEVNSVSKISSFQLPSGKMLIKQLSSNAWQVNRSTNGHNFSCNYTIISADAGLATTVIITFKDNLIKWLIPEWGKTDLNKTQIENFKQFMEDTKRYYGYAIRIRFFNEKHIIVKSKAVTIKETINTTAMLKQQLTTYLHNKALHQAGIVMEQYVPLRGDSLQIMVGLPVDKAIAADKGFQYMYIPPTKTVVGDFNGKYADRQKLYKAISLYVQDRYLHPKISPLEVFKKKLPTSASDNVEFQLEYPIF